MATKRNMADRFPILWLALAAILVIIFGSIYTVAQQSERADANDPQIQIAEDDAAALDSGTALSRLTSGSVDMNASLAAFVIIYGKDGAPAAGNGYLNGRLPDVPFGMLLASQNKPYSSVTWQPEADVRIAAVSVAAGRYYVLSGRSLRLVEQNESHTFELSLFGGACAETVLLAAFIVSKKYRH